MNTCIKKNNRCEFRYLVSIPAIVQNTTGPYTVSAWVSIFATWLLYFGAVLAFIYLVYSGILYITSGGNPDGQKRAQQGLISAIIGIIVIALAYTILRVANNLALGII